MSDQIQPEITTNILCRLPVKTLLRFRCVSKQWCSQIDKSYLINLHLKHSTQTNSNLSVILSDHKKLYTVDLDSLDKAVEINLSFKHPCHQRIKVVGSCNGLLCICDCKEDIALFNIALFNPSTKQCYIVPFMRINYQRGFGRAKEAFWVYGFGYNLTNDDYKVVRIAWFLSSDGSSFESEVMVYSLKTNGWSKLTNTPRLLRNSNKPGVFVGGALHWIMATIEGFRVLVAFDLGAEDFKEMPLPPPPECLDCQVSMVVGVLAGCLTVLANILNVRADLWVMNTYGVKESWTKLLSVPSPGVHVEVARPLAYSKNGSQVLLQKSIQNLFWYDLEKKRSKDVHIDGIPKTFDAYTCVGSLVPLNVHKGTHGKKQQAQEQKKNIRKKRDDDFLSKGFKLVL